MRKIVFTSGGSNSIIGNFAAGDTARVADDLAEHLVTEAHCARYDSATPAPPTRADLDAALAALPGGYEDPEYVVRHMRGFFGNLFTPGDEDRIRELVKATRFDPNTLTIPELKAALDKAGIAYDSNAKKADLVALYPPQVP